jgi:hypothetical protein
MTTTSTTTTLPPGPAFVGTPFSAFCSMLGRPQLMTGLFVDILQRHFTDDANIEEPDLRQLIWQPDERTHILIETAYRWRPELTQKRPAVIVKRNAYANVRMGIGDRRLGPSVDEVGDPHYVTYWSGSHTLFCLGSSGAIAELLAAEVQRELTEFGPIIRQVLGLFRVQVMQIGAVSILEEAQENFVVPVTVGYAYEERWAIREQAPRLANVSLSLLIGC